MLFPHFRQKFHFILPIQRSKVWIQKYLFVLFLILFLQFRDTIHPPAVTRQFVGLSSAAFCLAASHCHSTSCTLLVVEEGNGGWRLAAATEEEHCMAPRAVWGCEIWEVLVRGTPLNASGAELCSNLSQFWIARPCGHWPTLSQTHLIVSRQAQCERLMLSRIGAWMKMLWTLGKWWERDFKTTPLPYKKLCHFFNLYLRACCDVLIWVLGIITTK